MSTVDGVRPKPEGLGEHTTRFEVKYWECVEIAKHAYGIELNRPYFTKDLDKAKKMFYKKCEEADMPELDDWDEDGPSATRTAAGWARIVGSGDLWKRLQAWDGTGAHAEVRVDLDADDDVKVQIKRVEFVGRHQLGGLIDGPGQADVRAHNPGLIG